MVFCFASPVIVRPDRSFYGWLQRPIIGIALFAAALGGMHHGGEQTRTFDAFYITVVCLACTWLFSAGGVVGGQPDASVLVAMNNTHLLTRSSATNGALLARRLPATFAPPVEFKFLGPNTLG